MLEYRTYTDHIDLSGFKKNNGKLGKLGKEVNLRRAGAGPI